MPRIAAITIYIDNMKRATDFYTKRLGFAVEATPNPFITVLKHNGTAVVLAQAKKARKFKYSQDTGAVIGLASADLEKDVARLKEARVEFVVASPEAMPGGRFVAIRDPAGNVVELLQFDP